MQEPSEGGVSHVNEPLGVCLMQEPSEGGVSHGEAEQGPE